MVLHRSDTYSSIVCTAGCCIAGCPAILFWLVRSLCPAVMLFAYRVAWLQVLWFSSAFFD